MARRSRIGDLYEVRLDDSAVRYFQCVTEDETQLNSDVVRVFKNTYEAGAAVDANDVVVDEISFHAHVFVAIGLKEGAWRYAGYAQPPKSIDVLFRDSDDYGNPEVAVSRNWFVWKPNCRAKSVGKLSSKFQRAEIGVVVPPDSLIYRMRHGAYDFLYPDY